MLELSCEIADQEFLRNGQWNELIGGLPDPHVLQSAQWGMIKAAFGWDLHPLVWKEGGGQIRAAALVMTRKITIPGISSKINFQYVPKGPVLDWQEAQVRLRVLEDLALFGRRSNSIYIKIDPDVQLDDAGATDQQVPQPTMVNPMIGDLQRLGWQFSNEQIQFRNTIQIDLQPDAERLLAAMKQKTRYNIRLAARKGVQIRGGSLSDIPLLFNMYLQTSIRDHFVIREENYYREVWSKFIQSQMAEILIAEVDGEAVAGVVLFHFGKKGWFLYGMSIDAHRDKMPNYLLQWEAILHLKERGCQVYDLWGAPDVFTQTDPLWGVYRFKEGLGGVLVRHIGAWDLPLKKSHYILYNRILPPILGLMRWRGRVRAQNLLT